MQLFVDIRQQSLSILNNDKIIHTYTISTAKNGVGEQFGSEQTPRGAHLIRAKIGAHAPINAVFIGRRLTGEIFTPEMRRLFPERDWILTRIFWLSGLQIGFNRLGACDTMRRYIYIHGTPDDVPMGMPGSRGCIRMRNSEIVELFDRVPVGTPITIG